MHAIKEFAYYVVLLVMTSATCWLLNMFLGNIRWLGPDSKRRIKTHDFSPRELVGIFVPATFLTIAATAVVEPGLSLWGQIALGLIAGIAVCLSEMVVIWPIEILARRERKRSEAPLDDRL